MPVAMWSFRMITSDTEITNQRSRSDCQCLPLLHLKMLPTWHLYMFSVGCSSTPRDWIYNLLKQLTFVFLLFLKMPSFQMYVNKIIHLRRTYVLTFLNSLGKWSQWSSISFLFFMGQDTWRGFYLAPWDIYQKKWTKNSSMT